MKACWHQIEICIDTCSRLKYRYHIGSENTIIGTVQLGNTKRCTWHPKKKQRRHQRTVFSDTGVKGLIGGNRMDWQKKRTNNVITLSVCDCFFHPSIIYHYSSFSRGHWDSYGTRQAFHRRFVRHVSCMPSPAAETLDYVMLQAAAAKLHSSHEGWRQYLKLMHSVDLL